MHHLVLWRRRSKRHTTKQRKKTSNRFTLKWIREHTHTHSTCTHKKTIEDNKRARSGPFPRENPAAQDQCIRFIVAVAVVVIVDVAKEMKNIIHVFGVCWWKTCYLSYVPPTHTHTLFPLALHPFILHKKKHTHNTCANISHCDAKPPAAALSSGIVGVSVAGRGTPVPVRYMLKAI